MYKNADNLEYPTKFFYQSIRILKAYGLWHPEYYTAKMKILLILGRFIVFFGFGLYLYTNTYSGVVIYMKTGDTDRLIDALSYSTAILTYQIKSLIAVLNEKRIKGYINILEDWTYEYRNQVNGIKNVRRALKQFAFIFWMGEMFFMFTIFTYCWYPVLGEEGRIIPMETIITYGADMHSSPYYEIYVTYEYFGILSNSILCIAFDMMFCGILAVLSAIFKNLNQSMMNDLNNGSDIPSVEELKSKENLLINHIGRYIKITKLLNSLQDTYMLTSLIHFNYNCIIMGICLYQISNLPFGTARFLSMFGGFVSVSVQLITYCHFGQEVENQNQEFWNNLYMSDWYNQSRNFKQMIRLSLRRSQEENFICAGKIMPLSRDTMKRVLQVVYTYYMFLMKVRSDEIKN